MLDLVEREAAKPCGAAQCRRRHATACRRSRVIASTWQLELPSLCTLAAVATVAAATPNYFALVAMSRRRRGAGGGGAVVLALAIARAHKLGTGAQRRHWCKAPQRHHRCRRAALLCLRSSSTSVARLVAAERRAVAAAARTATIEQSSSTLYSFAMGTRTASNYDYYTTYYVY